VVRQTSVSGPSCPWTGSLSGTGTAAMLARTSSARLGRRAVGPSAFRSDRRRRRAGRRSSRRCNARSQPAGQGRRHGGPGRGVRSGRRGRRRPTRRRSRAPRARWSESAGTDRSRPPIRGSAFVCARPACRSGPAHPSHDSSITAFRSRIGVPSIAASARTCNRVGDPIAVTVTRCRPIGFGRSGERVANTPVNGVFGSPLG
jgi:hypothetical protein